MRDVMVGVLLMLGVTGCGLTDPSGSEVNVECLRTAKEQTSVAGVRCPDTNITVPPVPE